MRESMRNSARGLGKVQLYLLGDCRVLLCDWGAFDVDRPMHQDPAGRVGHVIFCACQFVFLIVFFENAQNAA